MSAVRIAPAALDLTDAAMYLSLSEATLERLVREGSAPKPRQLAGRRVGYLVRELDEWLESRPVSAQLPPPNTSRRKAGGPGLQPPSAQ
jgi:prophage regulatory protein